MLSKINNLSNNVFSSSLTLSIYNVLPNVSNLALNLLGPVTLLYRVFYKSCLIHELCKVIGIAFL